MESPLKACNSPLNCAFLQKEFKDVHKTFDQLKQISENIPRTKILVNSNHYWRGVCRSLIFRFPDDLEILILNKSKGIIQIKSSSRFGASDLGVNQRRISYLLKQLKSLKRI